MTGVAETKETGTAQQDARQGGARGEFSRARTAQLIDWRSDVRGRIVRSASGTTPGATGAVGVSWASRQTEQELSPSSWAEAPRDGAPCHPSIFGRCPWAAAPNPVIATTTATIAVRTTIRGARAERGRMETVTLDPAPPGVKRVQRVS